MEFDNFISRKREIEKKLNVLDDKLKPKMSNVLKLENNIQITRNMISRPGTTPESKLDMANKLNSLSREHTILLKEVRKLKVEKHKMLADVKLINKGLKNLTK